VYDLDDDLLRVPRGHPDAEVLRPKATVVRRMLRAADHVWVSTGALAETIGRDARVIPNGLDERIWVAQPRLDAVSHDPVRILCMGTATHDDDFALIAPALERLCDEFGGRVAIDMLGFSGAKALPSWVNRLDMWPNARSSYPGFVNWIIQQDRWQIGLAPLLDTPFNRCKSAIKTLDYGALGLAVVASDTAVYRGSLAEGIGGMLARNDPDAWYAAISRLLRDQHLRQRLRAGARAAWEKRGTLAAQAKLRRAALMEALEQ